MIARRTGPLLLLLFAGLASFVGRLAWIQVVEHEVWADEARRLLHSGTVLPYERGTIEDATGRALVQDAEAYRITVSYRDFRREHPLGQVTHALAGALGGPVSLGEVAPDLEAWAAALARVSPTELAAFSDGGPLVVGTLQVAPTDDPRADRRTRRAADLYFYVARLVDPERDHRRTLDRARRSNKPHPSFAALVAGEVPGATEADVLQDVATRAREAREALALFAEELAWSEVSGADDLRLLVEALDARRVDVADRAAARLAREVLGFSPGRVEPATLLTNVDLGWLQRLLAWDDARLADWARGRRDVWLAWRDEYALPYLLGDLSSRSREVWSPDRVLSLVAALHQEGDAFAAALDGRPVPWDEVEALDVLARLAELFPDAPAPDTAPRELPFLDPDLRADAAVLDARWHLLDRARTSPPGPAPRAGARWAGLHTDGLPGVRATRAAAVELAEAWEVAYQDALARVLGELRAAAPPEALGLDGRLAIDAEWLDQVEARLRFLVIDHGSRAFVLEPEPGFDAVHLLTRMSPRFGGIEAVDGRERVGVALAHEPGVPGEQLLGLVLGAEPEDLRRERRDLARLAELRREPERTPEEDDELRRLLESVRLADEARGVSGIEAHWDEVLRGSHGFREAQGLEDLYGRGRRVHVQEPEDGRDVTLTLHSDVQLAVERALWNARPPDDDKRDDAWYAHPVGAAVLLTIEGDVVAAASSPPPWATVGDHVPPVERPLERTLGKPDFQPPGSVFKPFVAAWALSHLGGYDPAVEEAGERLPDGRVGWGGVRCWSPSCHGAVDLTSAIEQSCNAYFSKLGQKLSTEDFRDLADAFGFREPTGVRQLDGRGGLAEQTLARVFEHDLNEKSRRRAGNGLSVVEATPMQVARATLGLARGDLPFVRLVGAVGGEPVPRREPEPIDVRPEHLELVRAAMRGVANGARGTARDSLSVAQLGFEVAVKTGSADLVGRDPEGGLGRKHTWVAGWAPADDPKVVFVVFVHDTTATSSHGATWVTRDLLLEPTVRAFLEEEGVPR